MSYFLLNKYTFSIKSLNLFSFLLFLLINTKKLYLSKIDEKGFDTHNKEFLRNSRFWLAASTHRGEEQLCINTHIKIKETLKKIITVIAPRHIERTREIVSLCKNLNLNVQILNDKDIIQDNMDIIIVNSFGVLNNFYKYQEFYED